MIQRIRTKFLVPILILMLTALAALGYIGYHFSSNLLRDIAVKKFTSTTNDVYESIYEKLDLRLTKIKNLLANPVFIKFSAAPYYKSDVDVAVFNFQKGNGLALGEPKVGGFVNYPIGLLPNSGNQAIVKSGIFPSEEYVGTDGIVKQHVYFGGSNDKDFEEETKGKLNRSSTPWFKVAMEGRTYIGSPTKTTSYLREYEPIEISGEEIPLDEI